MRITFLQRAGDEDTTFGASFRGQADLLAARGHRVTLVVVDGPDASGHRRRHAVSGVRVRRVSAGGRLREQLRKVRDDVVVAADPALLAEAARELPDRVGLVHEERRMPTRLPPSSDLAAVAGRVGLFLTSQGSTARRLESHLAPAGPRVVALPSIAWCAPEPASRPSSGLDSRVIVVCDDLRNSGDFVLLMRAFADVAAALPDWRLRIHGDGPAREGITRPIRKHALSDRVELPGQLEDPQLEWSRAAVALHVAPEPDLAARVRAAAGAGVPLVAVDDASGAGDFVVPGSSGLLVAPGSVPGLATAMLRVATDTDLRHRLGTGAREWFEKYAAAPDLEQLEQLLAPATGTSGTASSAPTTTSVPTTPAPTRPGQVTPGQARAAAFEVAVAAARRASGDWFVIPGQEGGNPVVVVPAEAQADLLAALEDTPQWISLAVPDPALPGPRRGSVADLAPALARARVPWLRLEPWPDPTGRPDHLVEGGAVDVELWDRSPAGELVASRHNVYTPTAGPHPSEDGLVPVSLHGTEVRTLPVMAVPTVYECRFPIDVVYTWVDGDDPEWDEHRRARLEEVTGIAQTRESSGRARFVSRDELRYSMRSVHLFAPWVRRIHLVTAGQRPEWLVDHPLVHVVDHREILPAEALPTFNSHAIEAALHHVPDLAEHWIYLNDDVFLGRPRPPEAFFTAAGQPRFFPTHVGIGSPETVTDVRPWMVAAWNNRRLLEQAFGVLNPTSLKHSPHPQATGVLEEIEKRFPEEVRRTRLAPFRSESDLSLLSSLAQHYGAATGQAVASECRYLYVDLSESNVLPRLDRLRRRQEDFFCLGDHHDHAMAPQRLREALADFLEGYFPVRAPWEAS